MWCDADREREMRRNGCGGTWKPRTNEPRRILLCSQRDLARKGAEARVLSATVLARTSCALVYSMGGTLLL